MTKFVCVAAGTAEGTFACNLDCQERLIAAQDPAPCRPDVSELQDCWMLIQRESGPKISLREGGLMITYYAAPERLLKGIGTVPVGMERACEIAIWNSSERSQRSFRPRLRNKP